MYTEINVTFGAMPFVVGSFRKIDALTDHVIRTLRPTGVLKSGDTIVRVSGLLAEEGASSDNLSVFQVA